MTLQSRQKIDVTSLPLPNLGIDTDAQLAFRVSSWGFGLDELSPFFHPFRSGVQGCAGNEADKMAEQGQEGQPCIVSQSRRPSTKGSPTACHGSDPVFIRSEVKASAA